MEPKVSLFLLIPSFFSNKRNFESTFNGKLKNICSNQFWLNQFFYKGAHCTDNKITCPFIMKSSLNSWHWLQNKIKQTFFLMATQTNQGNIKCQCVIKIIIHAIKHRVQKYNEMNLCCPLEVVNSDRRLTKINFYEI